VAADISKGNISFIFSGQEVNVKWQNGFSGRDIYARPRQWLLEGRVGEPTWRCRRGLGHNWRYAG